MDKEKVWRKRGWEKEEWRDEMEERVMEREREKWMQKSTGQFKSHKSRNAEHCNEIKAVVGK